MLFLESQPSSTKVPLLIGSRGLSSSYFYAGNICVFLLHCCFWKSVSPCCTCHSYLVTLDSLLKTSCRISDSCNYRCVWGFPSGSVVKNPHCRCKGYGFGPWVWEDPLEEEMATHSSILAWKILWTKEPGRLQSMGSKRVEHD